MRVRVLFYGEDPREWRFELAMNGTSKRNAHDLVEPGVWYGAVALWRLNYRISVFPKISRAGNMCLRTP